MLTFIAESDFAEYIPEESLVYEKNHAYSDKGMVVEDESYFTPADCGSLNFDLFQQ